MEATSTVPPSSKPICRLADDGCPTIPRRTSSISLTGKQRRESRPDLISLHRQSVQLFSSLDGTMDKQRDSFAAYSWFSSVRNSTISSGNTSGRHSYTPQFKTTSFSAGMNSDDNPLSYTLARKQSSLPSTYEEHDESYRVSARSSHFSNYSLYLSSFPEPPVCNSPESGEPVSALPTSPTHVRNVSNYHIFPPSDLNCQNTVSKPPITTTRSYSSQDPTSIIVQTQNLHDDQERKQSPVTYPANISWTSPESRLAEYAKIDQAQSRTKKLMRMVMPKWLCGSLGGERNKFYHIKDEADSRSVRRYRVSDVDETGCNKMSDEGERQSGDTENRTNSPRQKVQRWNTVRRRRGRNDSGCDLLNEKYSSEQLQVVKSKSKSNLLCF